VCELVLQDKAVDKKMLKKRGKGLLELAEIYEKIGKRHEKEQEKMAAAFLKGEAPMPPQGRKEEPPKEASPRSTQPQPAIPNKPIPKPPSSKPSAPPQSAPPPSAGSADGVD